jgi:peptide/nickel transport system permease protein
VLFESALTFLGFGVPPPTASWGELLAQAQASGLAAWLLLPPALAIALVVLACNLMGDGLRALTGD